MRQEAYRQRDALLRLLAGLAVAVLFLSKMPIAPAWSRCFRAFVWSVLQRAEAAAQCLVFVEARQSGNAQHRIELAEYQSALLDSAAVEQRDVPSTAALLRRLRRLQSVLGNLSHNGQRLLRRLRKKTVRTISVACEWLAVSGAPVAPSFARVRAMCACRVSEPWPPPQHLNGSMY